jgi:hypothetical protein
MLSTGIVKERKKEKKMSIDLIEYREKRRLILDGWSMRFDEMEKQLNSSRTVFPEAAFKGMERDMRNFVVPFHFLVLDHIGDLVAYYKFYEENTKIVKEHCESQYQWKHEVSEVLEIKLKDVFICAEEKRAGMFD